VKDAIRNPKALFEKITRDPGIRARQRSRAMILRA
jgi:hypothetical protein